MVAADRAFGGTLDPPSIALVVLAVLLVAAFVPVPGGAGIAEAGIVGGFMVLGEQAAVAVPAVFAFRLATFWLPVAVGWASTRWLRGHAQLLS
jgi:undecaprenyl-diphosphatase